MSKRSKLKYKECVPCHGGTKILDQKEIDRLLGELQDGWLVNNLGRLYKKYKFSTFVAAMNFANKL